MTPPNQDILRKQILSNHKRLHDMGLQYREDLRFMERMSRIHFPETALQFAGKLSHVLDRIEFSRNLYGHETVPELDPDISIEIGKTVVQGLAYLVAINGLTTHMVVSGASGSGKTNVITLVTSAIGDRIPVILLDHKDEGLRFVNAMPDAAYLPLDAQRWNCLAGTGDQTSYVRYLSSQLAKLMALMPVTANAVQAKLLALCSDPDNLPSVSDMARVFAALARRELRSVLHTAARGFDDLDSNMGLWATVRQGRWPFDDHRFCVVPLKDCPTIFEHFHVALLFKHLADRATANGHTNTLRRLVVFDEGRGFFGKEMEAGTASGRINLQADIMTKCRSYGIGIVIGTQSIAGIQQAVVDNAGIFFALRTNSEQESKACCRRLGLDESSYMELINMPVGTAWVVSPWCRQPVKIRVPLHDLGDYPSEKEITRRMTPLWDSWDARTVFAPAKTEAEAKIDFREILGETQAGSETATTAQTEQRENSGSTRPAPTEPEILGEYFAMLHSIQANPEFGTSAHYKALGLSGGAGNRTKARLLELGWIEAVRIASSKGGRPRETLRITTKGREVLHESA